MARDQRVKVRIEATDQASGSIDKVEGRFQRLGTSIKANALKITAAIASIAVAFRQIEESAAQLGQKRALERRLESQGIAIDDYLGKLKSLSDNQIANNDLILSSNRALALGIQAEDIPGLLAKAGNASVEFGISVSKAFEDITTGIGRASPLILDNLAIQVDAVQVYKDYAASIDTSVESLTKQQKTIALTKAVLGESSRAIDDFSSKQDELTRNINRSKAAFENLTSAAGIVGGGLVQLATGGLAILALGITNVIEGVVKLGRAMVFLATLLPGVGKQFEGIGDKLKNLDDGLDAYQKKTEEFIKTSYKGGAAAVILGLGIEEAGEKAGDLAEKFDGAKSSVEDLGDAFAADVEEINKLVGGLVKMKNTASDTTGDLDDLAESTEKTGTAGAKTAEGFRQIEAAFSAAGRQAVTTTRQFDALAASAGRAAATVAAVAGGGTLVQGGTRIRLPGGGSRLTSTPGIGGNFFNPEVRSIVTPGGGITFI